jgi:hypothetical protein
VWVGDEEESGEMDLGAGTGFKVVSLQSDPEIPASPTRILVKGKATRWDDACEIVLGEGGGEALGTFKGSKVVWRRKGPPNKVGFLAVRLNVSKPAMLAAVSRCARLHGPDVSLWPHCGKSGVEAWTREMDETLVAHLNKTAAAERGNTDRDDSLSPDGPASFSMSPFSFPLTSSTSPPGLQFVNNANYLNYFYRVALLQNYNSALNEVGGLVDLCNESVGSLGHSLRSLSPLVLQSVKGPKLRRALELTRGAGGNATTVILDNFLASKSIQADHRVVSNSQCIFVQAFQVRTRASERSEHKEEEGFDI